MGLNASQKGLLDRWDTYLGRLEQRSEELRQEAGAGMQSLIDDLLAAPEVDTRAVHNALSGIEGRLNNLPKKIDKAWEDECEPLVDDANEDYEGTPDVQDMANDRMDDCKARLENAVERFKLRWSENVLPPSFPEF